MHHAADSFAFPTYEFLSMFLLEKHLLAKGFKKICISADNLQVPKCLQGHRATYWFPVVERLIAV